MSVKSYYSLKFKSTRVFTISCFVCCSQITLLASPTLLPFDWTIFLPMLCRNFIFQLIFCPNFSFCLSLLPCTGTRVILLCHSFLFFVVSYRVCHINSTISFFFILFSFPYFVPFNLIFFFVIELNWTFPLNKARIDIKFLVIFVNIRAFVYI